MANATALAQPTGAVGELAPPKESLFVLGIVHPFYVNHRYGDYGAAVQYLGPEALRRDADLCDISKYMAEEFSSADKMLANVRRAVVNPSARLVFVSHSATSGDYERIIKSGPGVITTKPEPSLKARDVREAQERLVRLGFKGFYDELWLLARAVEALGPERISFSRGKVDMDAVNEELSGIANGALVSGLFMGSYSSQCVTNNKNDFCMALNLPLTSIAVRKSAGVDRIWPLDCEKKHLTYGDARDLVKTYRTAENAMFRRVNDMLNPSMVRTYLQNPSYFEETFRPFTLENMEKTYFGNRLSDGGVAKSNFPFHHEHFDVISDFLSGNGVREYLDYRRRPWEATNEQIREFRLELAGFLAGGDLREDEIPAFRMQYNDRLDRLKAESTRR